MIETAVSNGAELSINLGVLIASVVAVLAGYYGPKVFGKSGAAPAQPVRVDAAVAGVALELGNNLQTDRIITQLTRIADALENKNQEAIEDRLDALARQLEKKLG